MSSEMNEMNEKNKKTSRVLMGVIVGMFLLGFASIPIYRIYCAAIDPGGSSAQTGEETIYGDTQVDTSRVVKIRFATEVNRQLPWTFGTKIKDVTIHPGEKQVISFRAKNNSPVSITGKAVYDINPPEAGQYFKKLECFCFTEQELAAGEEMDMALRFWFEPEMPKEIKQITIAYTFFNMESSLERSLEHASR